MAVAATLGPMGERRGLGRSVDLGPKGPGREARCRTLTVSFLVGRFGSPTKIDYRKKSGTLILTSLLLEDLD